LKKSLWIAFALIIGILPGFFLVFNFMFSDIISLKERVLSFLIVIAAYLILGAAFGLAGSDISWRWGIWLSLPAIIIASIYSFSEAGTLALNLAYSASVLGSSAMSSFLASKLLRKRKQ